MHATFMVASDALSDVISPAGQTGFAQRGFRKALLLAAVNWSKQAVGK